MPLPSLPQFADAYRFWMDSLLSLHAQRAAVTRRSVLDPQLHTAPLFDILPLLAEVYATRQWLREDADDGFF